MSAYPLAHYKKSERLFLLYQQLPRQPEKAKTLTELMQSYGNNHEKYDSERKTLENDLVSLHTIFSELMGRNNALLRIPAWGTKIKGQTPRFYMNPNFSLDIINNETLFFWQMLANYTTHYLPNSLQQTIEKKLAQIEKKQKQQFNISTLGQWQQHLITLPSVIHAPTLDNDVVATIHQALLNQQILEICYCNKWQQQGKTRTVYPHGLVFIDNMMYLSAFNPADDHIDDDVLLKQHRNFAVCRIQSARLIDTPIPNWVTRDGLSLKNLKQLGKLEPTEDIQIKLVLKVQHYACQHLYERPLSTDQTITDIDDTYKKVTATVANTTRLQDWLVGMSQLAVVLEPTHVRDTVYARLQEAMELYQQTDDKK
ncbi:helix-turn-helix transcriptional regulator [Psychrobacter sp. I-STPA10]|uniref:helix-turn-helix transcriptional regulator n=1 Tax=Psychrobacter sp. I-STPA10 TaxID=2585769 RepID=UPI001E57A115|nr:WYL domain-containing protein [Psychrobacter sp. I-STPA10]